MKLAGETTRTTSFRFTELALWGAVLLLLQVPLFPGVYLRGEVASGADILFKMAPWSQHAPPGFDRLENVLLYDPVMAFRPDACLVQASLRAGEWPLWNSMELGGLPLLANCQSAVFLPTTLLLLVFDVDTATTLFILIKLWACGMAAYISARMLGFDRWPSRFFSIAWGFSCTCVVWLYWPVSTVTVWAPLLLTGSDLIAQSRLRRGFFTLALSGAMILFAGHPETAFAFGLYIALYFVTRLIGEYRHGGAVVRPTLVYGTAWLLALGAYASQLLPFLEYVRVCSPMGQRELPVTPGALTTFWVPRFWGTNAEGNFWDDARYNSNLTLQQYVGMAVWITAILLVSRPLWRGMAWRRRSQAVCALGISALAMSIAMHVPLVGNINLLPGFNLLRTIYHEYFVLLALPLLATAALDQWMRIKPRFRDFAGIPVLIAVALTIVLLEHSQIATMLRMQKLDGYVRREMLTAVVAFTVIFTVIAARKFFAPNSRLWWCLVLALMFVDQSWPLRGLNATFPRRSIMPDTELIAYLQAKPKPCRINFSNATIVPGTAGNFGLEEWQGYDGLYPARRVDFVEKIGFDYWNGMFRACAIDYYLNDPTYKEGFPIDELEARGALKKEIEMETLEVLRNEASLPRARLVASVEVAPSVDVLFDRMRSKDFDPATTIVVEPGATQPLRAQSEADVGSATIRYYSNNRVVVSCEANAPAALVLADTYYPGWNAYIDGVKAGIFPAYYIFRGVTVPQGVHTIEFRYEPRSLALGLVISVASLFAGAVPALLALRGRTI